MLPPSTIAMYRTNTFFSLGLMPIFMGLSHLTPAIGAIRTATGSYQFPGGLFGLIGAITIVVDSSDKYKDIPLPLRPSKWVWKSWLYGLSAIVLACTVVSGLQAAIDIFQVLPVGLLWGVPCVPKYSSSKGLKMVKPKALLFEAKSLIVALCMANVCAEASMGYYCRLSQCNSADLRRRSFCLAVLYNWFRETSCDVRDIDEDAREGLQTLPVRLGKQKTMILMTVVGILLDAFLTQSMVLNESGLLLRFPEFGKSAMRVGGTMVACREILKYPRENNWAWGVMSLFGLVPVLFAQVALHS